MKRTQVLLTDDQLLVKEAWRILFSKEDDFVLMGETCTTDDTIIQAEKLKPDIIMLEINMPGLDGIETIQKITTYNPPVKVLVVTVIKDISSIAAAFRNGAYGYITKSSSAEEVFKAMRLAGRGHKYICEELSEVLIEEIILSNNKLGSDAILDQLTRQERRVVTYLQNGTSSREIATEMNISARTVEVHRYNILKKLNLPNTLALISYINKHKLAVG